MKRLWFLKKKIIFSVFIFLFISNIHFSSHAQDNSSPKIKVNLVTSNGVLQVLQQLLLVQSVFRDLLQVDDENHLQAIKDLESILDRLEEIAILIGATC